MGEVVHDLLGKGLSEGGGPECQEKGIQVEELGVCRPRDKSKSDV